MVEVLGQNSNRNTVKQTAENGQKISARGDEDAPDVTSLVPSVNILANFLMILTGYSFFQTNSSTPVTTFVYLSDVSRGYSSGFISYKRWKKSNYRYREG